MELDIEVTRAIRRHRWKEGPGERGEEEGDGEAVTDILRMATGMEKLATKGQSWRGLGKHFTGKLLLTRAGKKQVWLRWHLSTNLECAVRQSIGYGKKSP